MGRDKNRKEKLMPYYKISIPIILVEEAGPDDLTDENNFKCVSHDESLQLIAFGEDAEDAL